MNELFDLESVVLLLKKYQYCRVALQFTDSVLPLCISVHEYLLNNLDITVDLFIAADSTFGSSVDDISALHIDSDVIVYFGDDLSSSGSVPVMVVPKLQNINKQICVEKMFDSEEILLSKSVLLLYEPGYKNEMSFIGGSISGRVSQCCVTIAELPNCANLSCWQPTLQSTSNFQATSGLADNTHGTVVGGLIVPTSLVEAKDTLVIYVGAKQEQLTGILLQMSEHQVMSYNPSSNTVNICKGSDSRQFRERCGGFLRVKDAQVIGIVIGSMGLAADVTQQIISRLQCLIAAARKKCYCFVMGRLSESKLCNFSEVDIYCLVANEDVAMIKPKTFHVPVITPYELELGLGARAWNSCYSSDIGHLLGDGEHDLLLAIENVKKNLPEDAIDGESEDDTTDASSSATASGAAESSGTLIYVNTSSALATRRSQDDDIVVQRYRAKEFGGLLPAAPALSDVTIQDGLHGTASSYVTVTVTQPPS